MFSRNNITLLILGISFLLKALMVMTYTDIGGDKIYQTAAAVQLAKGKGFTVEVRDPSNLDEVLNKPMMLWPPAYAALLAPLIKAGISPATATVVADVLNGICFLLLIYWATSLLSFPFPLKMLVLLFKATEINEAIFISTPSDYLSLNISLLAIICIVSYMKSGKQRMLWLFMIANAAGPWIRYSGIPLVVVMPVVLILAGVLEGERKWKTAGMLALSLALASVTCLLYFNFSRTGQFFYVLKSTPGFFPGNLQHLAPIVVMSFVNINFPLTQLSLRTGLSYTFFMHALKFTNLLVMIALLYYAFRHMPVWKPFRNRSAAFYFFVYSVTLSVATLLMLALLSITRSRRFRIDEYWVYIEEQRYMLPITVTLMLVLLYAFFVRQAEGRWPYHWLRTLLLFIMIAETAHGVWVMARNPLHSADESAIFYGNQVTARFIESKKAAAKREGWELILMDEDYNLRGYGLLKGIGIIDDPNQFRKMPMSSMGQKRVLFSVRPGHEPLYPFFQLGGFTYCGTYEHYRFYELRVPSAMTNTRYTDP